MKLIEKIEAAQGPDRDLDAEIAVALGWSSQETNIGCEWVAPNGKPMGLPRFTASFDAVLTILPSPTDGWWEIKQRQGYGTPFRHLGPMGMFHAKVGYWNSGHFNALNDNPILALLIAAIGVRK